jgi:hypothetical protein
MRANQKPETRVLQTELQSKIADVRFESQYPRSPVKHEIGIQQKIFQFGRPAS